MVQAHQIREHDAFLGHEMRGPAGTGRSGVSMGGGREGQGARKGNWVKGHRLPLPPCFFWNLLMYFEAFRWQQELAQHKAGRLSSRPLQAHRGRQVMVQAHQAREAFRWQQELAQHKAGRRSVLLDRSWS